MGEKNSKFILILMAAFLLVNFAASSAAAQEVGGNLGGSAGVFRSKKTAPAANEPKKTARKPIAAKPKPSTSVATKPKPAARTTKIEASNATENSKRNRTLNVKNQPSPEELFETAIEEGNTARDARNFDAAQKAYERALRTKPRDVRAAYGLATIFADQQRWDEAEKYYRQALTVDAANVEANLALSYVLVQPNRGGNVASRYADAEAAARRAIALDNDNATAFDYLGVALEARGIVNDATENAYRRAIELKPNYPVAYAHLARLLRKKGRNKDANNAYKKAIELANDVTNLTLVAEVLQSEQRFEESETLLRRIMTVDESNPTALFLLGRALLVRQNYAEAETVLQKCVNVIPKTFSPYMSLASVYLRLSQYEKAENALLKALPISNTDERKQLAGAFGLVGDGFLQNKKTPEAIRVYKKARDLDATNPQLQAKLTAAQATNQQ